jgi:type IX secretion system PorP/SprF family membrane protein
MKKITLLYYLILFSPLISWAQQEALFTHYMHNTLTVNPAYAGSRNALTIIALHRNQWVGFDGAPKTYTLTAHTPLFRENIGMGLSVSNDMIGPINNTELYGDFAYKIRINKDDKISLGIKGGLSHLRGNLSGLDLHDNRPDPAFADNINSRFLPNFGFGAYYFNDQWYVGLSSPRLLSTDYIQNRIYGSSSIISKERHYYLTLGSVFEIVDNIKFNPATMIRATLGAPVVMDISAMFILDDKFEFGLMHRTGDAFGALLGYHVNEQLRVGYSYDWSVTNPTFRYNGGSHEVILRYDFILKERERRIISPRYF